MGTLSQQFAQAVFVAEGEHEGRSGGVLAVQGRVSVTATAPLLGAHQNAADLRAARGREKKASTTASRISSSTRAGTRSEGTSALPGTASSSVPSYAVSF